MEAILAQFKPILDALGVEPWAYTVLVAFGIGHQYAKGTLRRWSSEASLLSAGVFSLAFGIGSWVEHGLSPVGGMTRIVVLFAASVLAEAALEKAANVVPFIPKNNQWVKEGDKP